MLKRYFQFAAIPCGVRTSLPLALLLRGASPTSLHATCPLPRADGAAGRSKESATKRHPTPCISAFPSPGVHAQADWGHAVASHPRLPASPFIEVEGRLNREGGTHQQPTILLADPCSPVWPHLGPVLSETGHAPAVHTHLHLRERTSSA